jgi:hypothetical protein
MNDPFTSLRRPEERAEPDPEFRNELLLAVRRRLDGDAHAAPPRSLPTLSLEDNRMKPTRGPNRGLMYAAAAVVVVGGLTAFAIVRADNDSEPQQPTAPAITTPTPATTTTTLPPLTDNDIAEAILLHAGEYAPGWQVGSPSTPSPKRLVNSTTARTLPSCARFVAPVFEATEGATVLNRIFYHLVPTGLAVFGQFVAVFADEASATAMVDAMSDPEFEACQADYLTSARVYAESITYPLAPVPEGWYGWGHVEPPFAPHGDQMTFSIYDYTWTHPVTREVHGPEEYYGAVVRVGRTVTLTGTLHIGDSNAGGNVEVVSLDQFDVVLAKVAERAAAALQGTVLPTS